MTLNESIEHSERKAQELEGTACEIEHKQLSEWLKELQYIREKHYGKSSRVARADVYKR